VTNLRLPIGDPVEELADPTFKICIVGIERRPCTGLSGRWRLPA
jgi:hypothetical protein